MFKLPTSRLTVSLIFLISE